VGFGLKVFPATAIKQTEVVVCGRQAGVLLKRLLEQRFRFLVLFFRQQADAQPPQPFGFSRPQFEIVPKMSFCERVVSLLLGHPAQEQVGVCVGWTDTQQLFQGLLGVVKPLELGIKHRQVEISLGLTWGQSDGFPEIDNGLAKLTPLGVDLGQVKIDLSIPRLQALSFIESRLGGVKLPRGKGLDAALEGSWEVRRSLRRCLRERKRQEKGCVGYHSAQRISRLPISGKTAYRRSVALGR
jgi:hypothetical protein